MELYGTASRGSLEIEFMTWNSYYIEWFENENHFKSGVDDMWREFEIGAQLWREKQIMIEF